MRNSTALGFGIGGAVLGAAALWGRRGGIGGGMPENVNINTVSDAISGRTGVAPTAFQAWEKGCDEALALTNTIWGLKVNTQEQMYAHRDVDVNEKFQIWKSQVDGDFGLYKSMRDLYDVQTDKLNTAAFGLYKGQRDLYDTLNERYSAKFCELDKKVYGMEVANLYQNKIIHVLYGPQDLSCNLWCSGFTVNPDSERTGGGEPLRMQLPHSGKHGSKRIRKRKTR